MRRIGYILFMVYAYGLAIMPFPILYLRSNVLAFLLCHVVRYRRKTVRDNLVKSFPELPMNDVKRIERRFYRNFCDLFLEMCKMLTMSLDQIAQHVRFTNPEVLRQHYDHSKSVLVVLPHSSNWEWFWRLMPTVSSHRHAAVYKAMENPYFDQLIHRLRTGPNAQEDPMVEVKSVFKTLEERRSSCNELFFLGDQSPRGKETDYWTPFLHRDTCWYTGMERVAKQYGYAVVYGEMAREGRGRYSVTFKTLCEEPQQAPDGAIMEAYVRSVEDFIQRYPDNWLWSHRRWKHTRPMTQE